MSDDTGPGFDDVTRLAAARDVLLDLVGIHDRVETLPVIAATGRVLAEPVTAARAVPHYERAAMDGYAVRAVDTQQAGRGPVALRLDSETVSPGTAVQVHTGSPIPDGADAVVRVEATRRVDETVEIETAVPAGENVAPVGEDVDGDQQLFDAGHRLSPADLGLLRAAGHDAVAVRERPRVSVVPTGEELVPTGTDPAPGEVVESNGLVVSELVEHWGGEATYRDVVTDDADALGIAVERDTDHDLVVTTGGTSVGERDLLPSIVAARGRLSVHGLAIQPGHPAGVGTVDETPVLLVPGYPVSCLVVAMQLLRPAIGAAVGRAPDPVPTTRATLERKLASEPGVRTFARVTVDDERATPLRTTGAGVLSSVAMADGWVVVPEDREGYATGDEVAVERWDWWP